MSSISLRLPQSLHTYLKELSKIDKISLNQFIVTAVAEKASSYKAYSYIQERAKYGSSQKYHAILDKVPYRDCEQKDDIIHKKD